MVSYVAFEKIVEGPPVQEYKIAAYDGRNIFSLNLYESSERLAAFAAGLAAFAGQAAGGLARFELGQFDQEYSNGGFSLLLQRAKEASDRIRVSLRLQSAFFDFGAKKAASAAELYLVTRPELLAAFAEKLGRAQPFLKTTLECVAW